jgi:pimeloyl-ACP methyl ester carboxylesterase
LFLSRHDTDSAAIRLPWTHGHEGAPVRRHRNGLPVVVYSPGFGGDRTFNTLLVEELASYGYLVITVDHTYEAWEVEFPGARVATRIVPDGGIQDALTVRVADVRFVLDCVATINRGQNPDAEGRPLPAGLRGAGDLSRTGMFGHSLGGATAAMAALVDPRVRAAVNLDGDILGPVLELGLDRPFLAFSNPHNTRCTEPSLAALWPRLRGWRRQLSLRDAQHFTFADMVELYPPAWLHLGLPEQELEEALGTIAPRRAVAALRAHLKAFFDAHLKGFGHPLDEASGAYPEVEFIRDTAPCTAANR